MDEDNIVACRICRACDSDSYISIFDEILNVPIISLMTELILQEISAADVAPTLICTECARSLRRAIKLKRLVTLNETFFNDPNTEISLDDPFLGDDDDLEFVEKPEPKHDTRLIENAYQKMKVEIFDEDQLMDDDNSDPLFDQNINLEFPVAVERVSHQKSNPQPEQEGLAPPVDEQPEVEDEVFSSDDSDDEDFYVDKNFVEPSDDEAPVVESSQVKDEQIEVPVHNEDEIYEGMDISCDEEYLDVVSEPGSPKPNDKQAETANLSIKRVLPRIKDRASVLEIPIEQLKFSCCMCHFIAPTETDLKTHLLNHPERIRRRSFKGLYQKAITDMKPKTGRECIKCCRIIDPAKMSFHLRYYYVEKKFVCGGCGERFGFFSEMRKHEKKCVVLTKTDAEAEKPAFVCNICDKVLMSKATLARHIYNMHEMTEEDRVKFKCNICGKGYPSTKNLKEHVKTHTRIATFPCTLCEKAFKTKVNLEIHLRVHFNERIYKCNYCDKSYIHYSDRHRHELSAHTGERPHKCPICGEGFVKKYSMTLHVRRVHTGEKPYVCDIDNCRQAFFQGSQLKQHKMKRHGIDEVVLEVVSE